MFRVCGPPTDRQRLSLCVSSPSQWRGKKSFSFFFISSEKNTLGSKSSADQRLPKEDCILTGIMNEHKEIIQRITNKIVFTFRMYCQWPITHCLQ